MSAKKNIQMTSRSITKQSSDNRLITEEEDKQKPKDIDEVDTARKSMRRDTDLERLDTRVET